MSDGTTTIEISIATRNKIHDIGLKIAQILRLKRKKSLSADQVINIILSAKGFEQQVDEMIING